MDQADGRGGAQFRADRPPERETVRTTIVGGRPPGIGQAVGNIPRGLEILVKKAAVDPAFKEVLLARRAEAAQEIGLELAPAETMMLAAAPATHLEAIIARTTVPTEHRRAFLGQAASAMLAVLGLAAGVEAADPATKGIRPNAPSQGIGGFGVRPDQPPEEKKPEADPDPIQERVTKLISKRLKQPVENVTPEALLVKDLKANAGQLSTIRKELEKEFKIELPLKTFRKLRAVGDLVAEVDRAVKSRPQAQPFLPNAARPQVRGFRPDQPEPQPSSPPDEGPHTGGRPIPTPVGGIRPDRPPGSTGAAPG